MCYSSLPAHPLSGCKTHLQEGDAPIMARQQLLSQLLAAAWQLQDHLATSSSPSTTDQVHSGASAVLGSQGPSQASICEDSKFEDPTPTDLIHSEDTQPGIAHSSSRPDGHRIPGKPDCTPAQPAAHSLSENIVVGKPDSSSIQSCAHSLSENAVSSNPEQGEPEVESAGTIGRVNQVGPPQNGTQGIRSEHGRMELLVLSWTVMPPGLEAEAFQLLDLASAPQHAAAAVAAAERSLKAALASSGRPCMMASARLGVGGQQGPSQVQPSSCPFDLANCICTHVAMAAYKQFLAEAAMCYHGFRQPQQQSL